MKEGQINPPDKAGEGESDKANTDIIGWYL